MIVRDEAAVIARSVGCALKLADEVVVVDTGSSDGTADIARSLGAKVSFFKWRDDFSAARNFSFSLASGEYVMWLDADDVVEEADIAAVRALVEGPPFDVAMLVYSGGGVAYVRERIFRRAMGFVWQGVVHEAVVPRGRVVYSPAKIVHKKERAADPTRNLFIYQKAIARGVCLDERHLFYYGRELYYCKMYSQAVSVLQSFLAGGGWAVNKAEACRVLYFCRMAEGDEDGALAALVRAFVYSRPRPRDCCLLASHFLKSGALAEAEYWYTRAFDGEDIGSGAFVEEEYSSYVPALGMAAVCDRRGDYASGIRWNGRALAARPQSKAALANADYFAQKLKNN